MSVILIIRLVISNWSTGHIIPKSKVNLKLLFSFIEIFIIVIYYKYPLYWNNFISILYLTWRDSANKGHIENDVIKEWKDN